MSGAVATAVACGSGAKDDGTAIDALGPSSSASGTDSGAPAIAPGSSNTQAPVGNTAPLATNPISAPTVVATTSAAPGVINPPPGSSSSDTAGGTTAPSVVSPTPAPATTDPTAPQATDPGPTATEMPAATGTDSTSPTPAPSTTATHPADHCKYGYDPDPTDETMTSDNYAEYTANGQTDTTVQPEVIAWMEKTKWQSAHYQWHAVRRCGGGAAGGFGGMMAGQAENTKIDICSLADVPANQECKTDGDGYEFMAMHRHMITSLKALWPKHAAQFEGWEVYPQSADDVPEAWRDSWTDWDPSMASNLDIAQNVDKHLDQFASEGAFGEWMQCMTSGIHGALHFKWVRQQNQDHGLGNQYRNIDNYMFWKMHGWMDKVWEKYRVAKGLAPDEPKLVTEIENQCREMDALALIVDPSLEQNPSSGPIPEEHGVFVDTVRPIFEGALNCAGCHGPQAPSGDVSLGGQISSSDIVANLVNRDAEGIDGYKLVVPGDPEHSWLYLKVSGGAAGLTCSATDLCTEPMPPTSMVLTDAEKKAIYDWIKNGAEAPTAN
ncbi:MAG TPA: hypothetical protein VHM70_00485 [Polyangiaceae bacterium]|jgi:hypothetical protein|nr:hypothetical protein [Polyangiaceae bacterium]